MHPLARVTMEMQQIIGMVWGAKAAEASLGKLASENKSITNPKVIAKLELGGIKFQDTNQAARPADKADPNQPNLVGDRVLSKEQQLIDKGITVNLSLPNSNMANAHAEIGVMQQAYEAGLVKDADLKITVTGDEICSYCRCDIVSFAKIAGAKSITVFEANTGLTYYWQAGMKKLEEKK